MEVQNQRQHLRSSGSWSRGVWLPSSSENRRNASLRSKEFANMEEIIKKKNSNNGNNILRYELSSKLSWKQGVVIFRNWQVFSLRSRCRQVRPSSSPAESHLWKSHPHRLACSTKRSYKTEEPQPLKSFKEKSRTKRPMLSSATSTRKSFKQKTVH